MAAKLPAAATTASAWSGASRRASRTVAAARPPPIAISGASGPTTAPNPRLTSAASAMPEQRQRSGRPTAGLEAVERRLPAAAGDEPDDAARPAGRPTPSSGSGHHAGTGSRDSEPVGVRCTASRPSSSVSTRNQ